MMYCHFLIMNDRLRPNIHICLTFEIEYNIQISLLLLLLFFYLDTQVVSIIVMFVIRKIKNSKQEKNK